MKDTDIIQDGLYIVSDQYFQDYPSPYLMQNKGNARPTFYTFKDNDGIYWMIPLSTQVQTYRTKQATFEDRYGVGNCVYYAFAKIAGIERVLLIERMFPVTESYILRPYKIGPIPYIVKDRNALKDIKVKAKAYLALLKNGKIRNDANILFIKNKLLSK